MIDIVRLEEHHKYGTLGVLRFDSVLFCATLEPPDKLNAQMVSSIPAKPYMATRRHSAKLGRETFEVSNVPGRSHILFHAGNTVEDTAGCIILGQSPQKLRAKGRKVINSGTTFEQFMELLAGINDFRLVIREMY